MDRVSQGITGAAENESAIRLQALRPGKARDDAYLSHPMVTGLVEIPTPQIQEAYEAILVAVVKRRPALCFYGDFRVGKSYAISFIQRSLPQSFPSLPIRSVIAKDHEKPTEKALFSDLLFDLGHALHDVGGAPDRRIRLIEHLKAMAESKASNRLLLFIDEAQNYSIKDLTRIRDLVNDIHRFGITLTIIFFGDHKLVEMRAALVSARRKDLLGRFFLAQTEFRPITSVEEVQEILRVIDDPEISSFPIGSCVSYSEFFQQELYGAGWRLANEAPLCWQAFASVARCATSDLQVGMQWFMSAVCDFLSTTNIAGHPPDNLQIWLDVVRSSGFGMAYGLQKP